MVCRFKVRDYVPCVVDDGDYCYSASHTFEPMCRGCGGTPEETGVPKPRGFDAMVKLFRYEKQSDEEAEPSGRLN